MSTSAIVHPTEAQAAELVSSKLAPHPRLLLPPGGATAFARLAGRDGAVSQARDLLLARAESIAGITPKPRKLEGKRLLHVSREYLRRITTLASAWMITRDQRFLDQAERELMAAASFEDWNPSHFLDAAEMTAALALGYDWLHEELNEAVRLRVRQAIVEKGLKPSFAGEPWWISATNNWNQVCHGGLLLGALAIAEDEPEWAAKVVSRAVASLPVAMAQYAPDGAYPEGPGYWSYGTIYNVLAIAALESALGTDFGLADMPGFAASASYYLHATAPSGDWFNYSDCGSWAGVEPAVSWFAARTGNPSLEWFQQARLRESADRSAGDASRHSDRERYALPLFILWHRNQPLLPPDELDWVGGGTTPVAMLRSGWTAESAYVGIKGGSPSASHAHMDVGSFVYEWGGVRWAVDLGMQDYNGLEQAGIELFDMRQPSSRWSVFRLGHKSHSVLSFDGQPQLVQGSAGLSVAGLAGDSPEVTVDCSSIYAGKAAHVIRSFRFESRRSLVVRDEVGPLTTDAVVRWQMPTFASAHAEGAEVVLRQDGKEVVVRCVAPSGAVWRVEDASRPMSSFDAPNPALSLLVLETPVSAGQSLSLEVELTPR